MISASNSLKGLMGREAKEQTGDEDAEGGSWIMEECPELAQATNKHLPTKKTKPNQNKPRSHFSVIMMAKKH